MSLCADTFSKVQRNFKLGDEIEYVVVQVLWPLNTDVQKTLVSDNFFFSRTIDYQTIIMQTAYILGTFSGHPAKITP